MKKDLRVKGTLGEDGFEPTHWYATKKVCNHKNNLGKSLSTGWNRFLTEVKCTPACPSPNADGYWDCISGVCIFFPI